MLCWSHGSLVLPQDEPNDVYDRNKNLRRSNSYFNIVQQMIFTSNYIETKAADPTFIVTNGTHTTTPLRQLFTRECSCRWRVRPLIRKRKYKNKYKKKKQIQDSTPRRKREILPSVSRFTLGLVKGTIGLILPSLALPSPGVRGVDTQPSLNDRDVSISQRGYGVRRAGWGQRFSSLPRSADVAGPRRRSWGRPCVWGSRGVGSWGPERRTAAWNCIWVMLDIFDFFFVAIWSLCFPPSGNSSCEYCKYLC